LPYLPILAISPRTRPLLKKIASKLENEIAHRQLSAQRQRVLMINNMLTSLPSFYQTVAKYHFVNPMRASFTLEKELNLNEHYLYEFLPDCQKTKAHFLYQILTDTRGTTTHLHANKLIRHKKSCCKKDNGQTFPGLISVFLSKNGVNQVTWTLLDHLASVRSRTEFI